MANVKNVVEQINEEVLLEDHYVYETLEMSSDMFELTGDCVIERRELSIEDMKDIHDIEDDKHFYCVNQSQQAIFDVLNKRFGIQFLIPDDEEELVKLEKGDCLVVLNMVGLPHLTDRNTYTHKEIESARFSFVAYFIH